MRVATLNVNGLRSAYRKGFEDFVADVRPDVICLQEVRADRADIPDPPAGYHAAWLPAERSGYSGVGVLTRVAPDAVRRGIGVKKYDPEGRVLRVDVGDVSIVSVYIPSGTTGEERQDVKMKFLRSFVTYTRELLEARGHVLLAGDFNIAHREVDLKNWRSNRTTSGFLPEERRWFGRYLGLGLVDTTRELVGDDTAIYSWWSYRSNARARNVGWRLDYQLTSPALHERAHGVDIPMEPVLSDHAPVIVDYDLDLGRR